jgi:hypothetical protein
VSLWYEAFPWPGHTYALLQLFPGLNTKCRWSVCNRHIYVSLKNSQITRRKGGGTIQMYLYICGAMHLPVKLKVTEVVKRHKLLWRGIPLYLLIKTWSCGFHTFGLTALY